MWADIIRAACVVTHENMWRYYLHCVHPPIAGMGIEMLAAAAAPDDAGLVSDSESDGDRSDNTDTDADADTDANGSGDDGDDDDDG